MGVPKFHRFISDRYPCINKTVKEYEIPEYENLYLDMNSIIHVCAHPSDSDVHFRIAKKEFSDEDIYQNVCRYVEIIFSIIKPADLMYLAFDGVAPRAKMNQQRGHRFRNAKDINEAVKNEVIKEDTLFDANCITPGTAFMVELIDHVKHFVAYKISTDSAWQKCKIIVSGPEVPGEGEHKIMEYIRYKKAQPNYNQNTRHCLYSLDADLIILGISTHEPHFSLIREKVTFGKRMNMITPEESDFDLLHLSLLREYLEYEFTPIKSKLKFPFDMEKIIDDWVLIGFLVGNDFIPQLPSLNIVDGALPLLYQTYMKVLPTLDGYMNEFGELNLKRFKIYIKMLSETHINVSNACGIPEFLVDEPESENKNSNNDSSSSQVEVNNTNNKIQSAVNVDLENRRILIENAFKELDIKSNTDNTEHSEETKEISLIMTENINKTKETILLETPISKSCMKEYYRNKLKFHQIDKTEILTIVQQYLKAIQWTLRYYYQGCCSWSWYYPYHYAPLTSDFDMLQDMTFDFTMNSPFLPLQHLLAVLPPANVHLLPKPLHFLLVNKKSPIIDFYPEDFEVDLNGKTNDWESVVLIPFIDETRLTKAMVPCMKSLSFKELKRNKNGPTFIFSHTKNSLGQYPVETIFGSFENHAQLEHKQLEDMHLPKDKLIQRLLSNVSFNLNFSGFPTLKHIPHSFTFSQGQSKFNTHRPTQIERMILRVSPKLEPILEDLAKEFLGQNAYACWPYMRDVHIIGVTDFKRKIMLINFWKGYSEDNIKNDELVQSAIKQLHNDTKLITAKYKDQFGIDIGKTNILFYLFPLMGKKYACMNNGKIQLQMKWSPLSKLFPYHLVIKDDKIRRSNIILYKSINDFFINRSVCFLISQPNYGAKGEIKGLIEKQQLVSVMLESSSEPDFSSSIEGFFVADTTYMSCNKVAEKVKISSILISRITGSLIVTEDNSSLKYYDIGLRMKFPKHEKELFGYTKKDNKGWLYSEKAVQLIQNYVNEFPYVFENLNKNVKSSTFAVSDLFPDGLAQVNLLKVWLFDQQAHYTTFLECHTKTLGLNGVPVLEKHLKDFYSKEHKQTVISTQVKAQSLFIPGTLTGLVPPDFKAEHKLLDRIICVKNNFSVPLGLKGTIIGIQGKAEKCKNVYEVLFDSPFTGGLTLYQSSEHKCYRLMATDFINISFGQCDSQNSRQLVENASSKVSKSNSNQSKKNPVNTNNPRKEIINNTDNKAKKNPRNEVVSNINVNNDNNSSNTSQVPRNQFQVKNHKFCLKKTYNTARNSKEFTDCNSNEPSNFNSKIETNNPRPHNTGTRPKTYNSNATNNSDGKVQDKNPQPKNTGTRPKTPFHKQNAVKFQGRGNQHPRNASPKKSMASEINKTEQSRSNNALSDPNGNNKSIDSNENKKH